LISVDSCDSWLKSFPCSNPVFIQPRYPIITALRCGAPRFLYFIIKNIGAVNSVKKAFIFLIYRIKLQGDTMKVLIVGSVALDTIKTPFGEVNNILGGSAIYSSVSASNFAPVNLVAVVGSDFPKKHIALLMDKNINLRGMEIVKNGLTFRWEGEYGWDFADPKTLATHLNVFASFDPVIPAQYRDSEFLFLANIDPVIQNKVLEQVNKPKLVLCDTMNYWIASKRDELIKLLKKVDIFLLNESEAKQLSRKPA